MTEKNLTPAEHWELHQGLDTVVDVDKNSDRYYSYSSTSGSIYLGNSLGYLKEKRNGTM